MASEPWSYARYRSRAQEGEIAVPGAVLRYRLAGATGTEPTLVFENGWSAPFGYAVWLEQALAAGARVLCYDRAGVGDSRATAPLTAQGLTRQLAALLENLGIDEPVVVVGHSYGGLIGALHAAQAPELVRAVVQIDPTPEFDNDLVDPSLRMLTPIGRFLQICALLRIEGPLFLNLAEQLPPEVFAHLRRNRRWWLQSLEGSIAEGRLLGDIRRGIAQGRQCPRLVISGDPAQASNSWLRKLLMSDEKARVYWDGVHELHRRQASLDPASHWLRLPYSHVNLVTERDSAGAAAAHILDFIHRTS